MTERERGGGERGRGGSGGGGGGEKQLHIPYPNEFTAAERALAGSFHAAPEPHSVVRFVPQSPTHPFPPERTALPSPSVPFLPASRGGEPPRPCPRQRPGADCGADAVRTPPRLLEPPALPHPRASPTCS